jgi:beta-galactosidase GanA
MPGESVFRVNSVVSETTSLSNSGFSKVVFMGWDSCTDSQISLWNVQAAIDTIDQTYELDQTIEIWNYRSHIMLAELQDQVKRFACSGGIWTQTTDVEGEVNGLMTYDRRLARVDEAQWKADIQGLYDAAAARGHAK